MGTLLDLNEKSSDLFTATGETVNVYKKANLSTTFCRCQFSKNSTMMNYYPFKGYEINPFSFSMAKATAGRIYMCSMTYGLQISMFMWRITLGFEKETIINWGMYKTIGNNSTFAEHLENGEMYCSGYVDDYTLALIWKSSFK